MERRVKVLLRCLVVVFFVIVCRFDHDVSDLAVVQVEKFPDREAELFTPEQIQSGSKVTVKRPFQFFGLL